MRLHLLYLALAAAQVDEVCLRFGEIDDDAYAQRPVPVTSSFLSLVKSGGAFLFKGERADVISSSVCSDEFCNEIVSYLSGPRSYLCAQVLNAGTELSPVTANSISANECRCNVHKLADVCSISGPSNESCIRPHQTCNCSRYSRLNTPHHTAGIADHISTCERLGVIDRIAFENRPTRQCLPFANATWQGGEYVYQGLSQHSVHNPDCDDKLCSQILSLLESEGCAQIANAGVESPLRARLLSKTDCSCEVCKVADMCTMAAAPGEGCVQSWQNCTCTSYDPAMSASL